MLPLRIYMVRNQMISYYYVSALMQRNRSTNMAKNIAQTPLALRATRLGVATSLLCIPATPAYALSLGDVTREVASSPWACFGLGCAAGAVVVGLVSLRSRRRLEERVQEAVYAAEMAQRSAARAEKLIEEAQGLVAAQAQAEQQTKAQVQQAAPVVPQRVPAVFAEEGPAHGAHMAPAAPVVEPAVVAPEAEPEPKSEPMSPAERAASIDARVPGFDQSLFPDLVHESTPKLDDFELAMKAMDETLSATLMLTPQQPEDEVEQLFGAEPEFADASSYVDYLVQDEIERNRAGQARRFSRSQLTVFDGTGDISSTRKNRPRPRHLAPAVREA